MVLLTIICLILKHNYTVVSLVTVGVCAEQEPLRSTCLKILERFSILT